MTELTVAQLRSEVESCEYCELKPCRDACPAHCSPADFIRAAKIGDPSDFLRAAAEILSYNPLGGVCGAVCPETHCMAACARVRIDGAVEIRDVQQTVVQRATALGLVPRLAEPEQGNGRRVAIIGAGPAGLAAAMMLSRHGYDVEIFERGDRPGGAMHLIPAHRLPRAILEADLKFVLGSDRIRLHTRHNVADAATLTGFDAVILATGLTEPIHLGIEGEEAAVYGWDYLSHPEDFVFGGPVAVVGGGAVACDCATTARLRGAERVEIFALEKLSEMPLADRERQDLMRFGIQVSGRTRLTAIRTGAEGVVGLTTLRVTYPRGDGPWSGDPEAPEPFDPRAVKDLPGSSARRDEFRHVIVAIGHRSSLKAGAGVVVAGDCDLGPSTVVQAVASGKNAALEVHARLSGRVGTPPPRRNKSLVPVPGYEHMPVALDTDFFGRRLSGPFLLSAAPPTDGYEQMRRGLAAGWAGGIMKTAFDNVPIHIPGEYMFTFGPGARTWGNCDNVSGHPLDRVCREIEKLAREFPDRLVGASTGGPVTGHDARDAAVWQSNTRKLESAGAQTIEYSLSCPQGGDGTEGDIVSQNAALSVKIIEWIVGAADPDVPKLFKLTAAVTSITSIALAIKTLFELHPEAKLGITLANSFPALGFRPGTKKEWDEGVVVGLSGEGIVPISNLSLAKVAGLGLVVSANGGPLDHKAAAGFLALGARNVQFCTAAMKYGYGVIDDLNSGLSHLLQARGLTSVGALIGAALPHPITDFMALPATKKISAVDARLCVGCGNCSRCSYLAITMDEKKQPTMDPSRCVGCGICAQQCMSGALFMRERTADEHAALREA